MRDIQTSLDCPEIEMKESTSTTPEVVLNNKETEYPLNKSNHTTLIIKTDSIPVNVTIQEIQASVANWDIPITNIRIGKRRINNETLKYATIKVEDMNRFSDPQHERVIIL